ncbi:hypothetical protein [Micromonospora cathayae]|uniref:SPFH domain / Band 7 family protein n=1 Tax=Micromonospora cathayae TaxID=3028804 RepID=A0ABY7ZV41_9ACTN|nr:hypothetical protein [Micromonospora sp. HUAS 3]WDZ86007.1 hypothetical protein PVK37_06155 [Micromonospora sp. HUAS 3]
MPYPVLTEKNLPPVLRRLIGTRRRLVTDLPSLPPGAVYVFKVNGQHRLYGDRHVDHSDETVVDAVAVSVVQRRAANLQCVLAIPSASAADEFTVVVNFRCQVLTPEAVAEAGLNDLVTLLTTYLWQDRELKNLGLQFRIEDINDVRRQVDARITAYCHLVPPVVPGMDVALSSVVVHPSADLRAQRRRVRDKKWDQEVGRLDVAWQNEEIDRYATLLSAGPTYADALGISRNEINVGQVAERMHDTEAERRRLVGAVVQDMVARGFLDRADFDPVRLVEELVGRSSATENNPALTVEASTALPHGPGARRNGDDTRPDFIPNEADID